MKFALATRMIDLYPPVMSRWEPETTGAEILRYAKKADTLRWDWMTLPEHMLMPNEMVEVMGARFPEGIVACSVLAGATQRIKFLTFILVLPYRHPIMLAKQISTLDFLSNGRFLLGTAVGHLEGEFEVLGIPFEERGAITDEYLAAMVEVWTKQNPSFSGKYVRFEDIAFEPKPVQKPHPPIFIGGNTKVAMRRAARQGDGWMPWLVTVEKMPECIDYLRRQPGFEAKADRFEVITPISALKVEDFSHRELGDTYLLRTRDEILPVIEELQRVGVTVSQVVPPQTDSFEQLLEWIEWFDSEIISEFRG